MLLFLLSVSLPGLNRKHCDEPGNGYTCKDLEYGVSELEKILAEPRTKRVMIYTKVATDVDRLFLRLFTVSLGLATNSIPVLVKEKQFSKPEFAEYGKKPQETVNFTFCKDIKSISKNNIYYQIEMNPSHLLLNPTLSRLYDRLGPAALHILMHLTLGGPEIGNETDYAVLWGSVKSTISGSKVDPKDLQAILFAATAPTFVHKLPDLGGFLVNLVRGRSPVVCDHVGGSCWRAKSYLAGGVNPLYPGTGRSTLDIARSNEACANTTRTRNLLEMII